jgi:HSP90 family molecular chaperone
MAITGRVVRFFEQQMRDDRVKYQQFYETFGVHFKEAIIAQLDVTANVRSAPLHSCFNFCRTTLQSCCCLTRPIAVRAQRRV